jgi:hypothetical protein
VMETCKSLRPELETMPGGRKVICHLYSGKVAA